MFPFNQGQKRFTGAGENVSALVQRKWGKVRQSSEEEIGGGFQDVSTWFYQRCMFMVYLWFICISLLISCRYVSSSKGLKHVFRWWDLPHSFETFLLPVWKLVVSVAGRKTCEHCRVTCVVATCSKEDEKGPLWPFWVVVSIKSYSRLRPRRANIHRNWSTTIFQWVKTSYCAIGPGTL